MRATDAGSSGGGQWDGGHRRWITTRRLALPLAALWLLVVPGCWRSANPAVSPPKLSRPAIQWRPAARTAEQLLETAERKLQLKDHSGALEELDSLFSFYPDHLEGRILAALVAEASGDAGRAEAAWVQTERIIVVKGKIAPFTLKLTLLGAGLHYLQMQKPARAQLFLEELWRLHPASEAAAQGEFGVADIAFGHGRWAAVDAACLRLRRVRPKHGLNKRCQALTYAAKRLRTVGQHVDGDRAPRWRWEAPTPQGNDLHGVWVAPDGQSVMVGTAGTIVQRGSRGAWSVSRPLTRWPLHGVHGAGERVLVVGAAGVILERKRGIWKVVRKGSPRHPDLFAVWVAKDGRAVAVGDDGVILHEESGRWVRHKGPDVALYGIWGDPSGEQLMAVGEEGTLLLYRGKAWKSVNSDAHEHLRAIWGTEASHVAIAGARRTVVFFDGVKSKESIQGLADFYGIWGKGPRQIWAVGSAGSIIRAGRKILDTWTPEPSGTSCRLNGISGGGGNVLAVGTGGTVVERKARRWRILAGGMKQRLVAVFAGPKPGQGAAIGQRGRLMLRHKRRWRTSRLGVPGHYFGGWSDGRQIVAVGGRGLIVRGSVAKGSLVGLQRIQSRTLFDLFAVTGCRNQDVVAVGDRGVVVRLKGDQARQERLPSGHSLRAVHGCVLQLAVGDRGTIVRHSGGRWLPEASGVVDDLTAVWVSPDGKTAFAAGKGGRVLQRKLGRWRSLAGPLAQDLVAIWGRSAQEVYVASALGQIMSYNGKEWLLHAAPTACLSALAGTSEEALAVGCNGSIIRLTRNLKGTAARSPSPAGK